MVLAAQKTSFMEFVKISQQKSVVFVARNFANFRSFAMKFRLNYYLGWMSNQIVGGECVKHLNNKKLMLYFSSTIQ